MRGGVRGVMRRVLVQVRVGSAALEMAVSIVVMEVLEDKHEHQPPPFATASVPAWVTDH